ncbi:MAG: hypothetical protein KDK30_05445 [Leptospiraceae bacterium]|nr:hypothetical protein [Leptospiraceae bacterium]
MRLSLLQLVCELGYPEDQARALILAGRVLVNDTRETRVGHKFPSDVNIRIQAIASDPGRGADKMRQALEQFRAHGHDIENQIRNSICLDVGASHGGFTRVLLDNGAVRVYALDVAYGILDYRLRQDRRVIPLERVNIRTITPELFAPEDLRSPGRFFVTVDVAFMSLLTVVDALLQLMRTTALSDRVRGVLLLKPQFENSQATQDGVIRDARIRASIRDECLARLHERQVHVFDCIDSPLSGARGNREFFLYVELRV